VETAGGWQTLAIKASHVERDRCRLVRGNGAGDEEALNEAGRVDDALAADQLDDPLDRQPRVVLDCARGGLMMTVGGTPPQGPPEHAAETLDVLAPRCQASDDRGAPVLNRLLADRPVLVIKPR
jgi:hypothetical protein